MKRERSIADADSGAEAAAAAAGSEVPTPSKRVKQEPAQEADGEGAAGALGQAAHNGGDAAVAQQGDTVTAIEQQQDEEGDDYVVLPRSTSRAAVKKGSECPYLDTVSRQVRWIVYAVRECINQSIAYPACMVSGIALSSVLHIVTKTAIVTHLP